MIDKRTKGTCKICGGKVERPSAQYEWSHIVEMLDQQHKAQPFPPKEKVAPIRAQK